MELVSADKQRLDFMHLLITELRHQNPLEPLDNQQMAAQLAQFSQLELSEKTNDNISAMNKTIASMNTSFEGAMLVAQMDYAKSLLGKTVEFYYDDYAQMLDGKVNRAFWNEHGHLTLEVESRVTHPDLSESTESFSVRLDAVEGIRH
ncbi:MAG: hypothetical protein GXY41_03645 [Phycisphaerae bacterium]|nr:hypothetical protein [Phycisphaerae bacterium]